jgi:hypothetical protein
MDKCLIIKNKDSILVVSSYFADDWWEDKYPFCP